MNLIKKTRVIDVIGLFNHWISIRIPPHYAEYHVQKDPLELIKNTTHPYALTTYQADKILHGYLFPTRTDLYVLKENVDDWHHTFLSNGLVGSGNTRILISDPHIIKNSFKKQDFSLVSKPQLISDLLMEGGVAVDAANLLIKRWYHDII